MNMESFHSEDVSKSISPKIIYAQEYNFHFQNRVLDCIRQLHPFDSQKYKNIWKKLSTSLDNIEMMKIDVDSPATEDEIKMVHSEDYLQKLKRISYVSKAIEVPEIALAVSFLSMIPGLNISEKVIIDSILLPMRWASKGTLIAAHESLKSGLAINLSGGYHHASRHRGEGFCIYSDVAIAIRNLQINSKVSDSDEIIIIDLDVHQGNGLERIFHDESQIHIFDVYNRDIYPQDKRAKTRVNNSFDFPLDTGIKDSQYLSLLQHQLPKFISSVQNPKIAFYIAGTDVFLDDPLGQFDLTIDGIIKRDKLVTNFLADKNIPCVFVLGGGYTKESATIVANSIVSILSTYH